MHDAGAVRLGQAVGDFPNRGESERGFEGAVLDPSCQSSVGRKPARQQVGALVELAGGESARQVRMTQLDVPLSLLDERRAGGGVVLQAVREEANGGVGLAPVGFRQVDRTFAVGKQSLADAVFPDYRAFHLEAQSFATQLRKLGSRSAYLIAGRPMERCAVRRARPTC